jgi:lipid A 3-O-deacylase
MAEPAFSPPGKIVMNSKFAAPPAAFGVSTAAAHKPMADTWMKASCLYSSRCRHSQGPTMRRISMTLAMAIAATAAVGGAYAKTGEDAVRRDAFVQVGVGEGAQMLVIGSAWHWPWREDFAWGRITSYVEASFGRWRTNARDAEPSVSAWVTQLGVTPVLRFHPEAWGGTWFVEAGIGMNVLAPLVRTRDKHFSTTFNFGDHVAIGSRLGPAHEHELSLRLQHFSNAGIKRPNPGQDFLQVRYSMRY